MSHTVTSRTEIPDAPFYVLSNDSFMSGWGQAERKTNTIILPCESYEEAETVQATAQDRGDQKNVRIVGNKPRLRPGVLYSLLVKATSPRWFTLHGFRSYNK